MRRLDAGYCRTFDSQGLRFHRIALTREAVGGFVFWTRNARPFLPCLDEVSRRGFPFIVQYGITGESADSVRDMHELAASCGPRSIVWRYEPMAITAHTTLAWHVENFDRLAHELEGTTDEAVLAFAEPPAELEGHVAREEKRAAV